MRKFLLFAMVMFTLPLFAQNYTMRMIGVYSNDGYETWDYVYPSAESTNIACINEIDFTTNTECIDSLFYDERGNIVRLATWQKIGGEWLYACYVDYTYNEMNLRTSRTNYNDFHDGWGFQLGGVYRYNYDEDGKMTDWALEFFGLEEYQKGLIEYDENGLKLSETIQQYNFGTYYLENNFMTEFEYDENGNVVREAEFVYEEGMWSANMVRNKEYDENGNCIIAETKTAAGTVQERKVFAYDTNISGENVFYYANPEDDYPQLPKENKNLLKSFEYYAQNDDMSLVYVTTYIVGYEEGNFTTALEEVAFESSVYPNPAQDYVMVESSEADYVEVVDVYGRVMFSSEMSESVRVDMSEFASGIYFVKLQAKGATSVQKVMKK